MTPQLDFTKISSCLPGQNLQLLGTDADAAAATFAEPIWGFTQDHAAGVCQSEQGSYYYDSELGRQAALSHAGNTTPRSAARFAAQAPQLSPVAMQALPPQIITSSGLSSKERSDLVRGVVTLQYEMGARAAEYEGRAAQSRVDEVLLEVPRPGDPYTWGTFATSTVYQAALFTAGTGAAMLTAQAIAGRIQALSRLYELLLRDDILRDHRARLSTCSGAPLVGSGDTFLSQAGKVGAAASAVAGLIATLAALGAALLDSGEEDDPIGSQLIGSDGMDFLPPPLMGEGGGEGEGSTLIYPPTWLSDLDLTPTDLRALSDENLQSAYDRLIANYHEFGAENKSVMARAVVMQATLAEKKLTEIDWESVADPELRERYESAIAGVPKSLLEQIYEWPEAETWEPVSVALSFGPLVVGSHLLYQHFLRHLDFAKNFSRSSDELHRRARDEARRVIEENLKPGGVWAECVEARQTETLSRPEQASEMTQQTAIHDAPMTQSSTTVSAVPDASADPFVHWALQQSRDQFLDSMWQWQSAVYQALQDELGDSSILGWDTGINGLGYALRQTFGGAVIDSAEIAGFMTRLDKIHDAVMSYYHTGDAYWLFQISHMTADVVQLQNTSGQWTSADEWRGLPYQIMGAAIVVGGVLLVGEALALGLAWMAGAGGTAAPVVVAPGTVLATATTSTGTTLTVLAGGATTVGTALLPLAAAAAEEESLAVEEELLAAESCEDESEDESGQDDEDDYDRDYD